MFLQVLLSGLSISYGIYEILESYYFGLPMGIFAAFFVLTLYIFILYTLTKNVLPVPNGPWGGRLVSLSLRILFLASLGLATSQPIEYYFFSHYADEKLSEDIAKDIKEKNKNLNIEFTRFINDAEKTASSKAELIRIVDAYKEEKKNQLHFYAEHQYSRNFFIRRMLILDTQFWYIWLCSSLFILLFLSPIILKRLVSSQTVYYKKRYLIENSLVTNHYSSFIASYNEIIQQKFPEENLEWHSLYADAPYNTKLKPQYVHHTDVEFEHWLLGEGIS